MSRPAILSTRSYKKIKNKGIKIILPCVQLYRHSLQEVLQINRTIKALPYFDVIQTKANESINLKRRLIKFDYTGERISPLRGELQHIRFTTQAEINNRTNVDPTLDTNFRLSADSQNDNDVLRWYDTSFQRCINTGNQHIFNAGCQHF